MSAELAGRRRPSVSADTPSAVRPLAMLALFSVMTRGHRAAQPSSMEPPTGQPSPGAE